MADGVLVARQFDDAEQQRKASDLGIWVFLATEILFFGVLFATYAITRFRYPEAFAAAPDMLTSFSAPEVAEWVFRLRDGNLAGYQPPGVALQIPPAFGDITLVTAESVAAAHRLGLEVHVWTINEPAEMEALLDLGVDGIMTDFPARGVEVLRGRGLR